MRTISETEGRQAFGANVQAYTEGRPQYPAWIFDLLVREDILRPAAATLEIGPGNGLATRAVIERGITRLTLVEPDRRFAPVLESLCSEAGSESTVIYEAFEDVELPDASFDVILIATAWHWLDSTMRAEKLAALTAGGGCVVLIWNVFQDLYLDDAFHEATKDLLAGLSSSPSANADGLPGALDRQAREAEFLSTRRFAPRLYAESHWQLPLDPDGVRSLYAGFSQISRLPDVEREVLLDQLETVAKVEFGGTVVRNMTSPLYVFQRV